MSNDDSPFHRGEQAIQSRLGVRDKMESAAHKVIRDHMPEQHQTFYSQLPLFIVGADDATGRPWASALAGRPGFLRAIDSRTLEVAARPVYGDVLAKSLLDSAEIGGLGLEFSTRRRNRVNGWVTGVGAEGFSIRVAQSFGNCPQYIQARELEVDATPEVLQAPRTIRCAKALGKAEAALIADADTFFIASQFGAGGSGPSQGIDVSHRGGLPGFVIVAHETLLLFPDYSGNCMFNTLGNLMVDPRCGLLFIDFDTGDMLQVTGEADVLWESHHTSRFPGAERVVAFRVEEARVIEQALPISAEFKGHSPVFEHFEPVEATAPSAPVHDSMKLLAVNVSGPKEVVDGGKTVTTGIFKQPVVERIMLRRLNLERDGQADLWGHGGTFRAVYVYSTENYDYWRRELGRDLPPGSFGENFTVEGMPDDEVCIGDVLRIGDALVEVTQPRIPCYKLAIKLGIPDFQKRFLQARRVGFYLRVLREGEVGAGDAIKLAGRDPQAMTVDRVNGLLFFDKDNLEDSRRALSIPGLSHGWKESFEERLAKAQAEAEHGFRSFQVERKVPESDTITSFYLMPEDGKRGHAFLPGQFLTFRLSIPGEPKPVIRTYSLSDSPGHDYYRVSIKREAAPVSAPNVRPGLSSTYFHNLVEPGAVLETGPPRGKFHIEPHSDRALVLLSAGVGLTPMVSMTNAVVESGAQRRVWFIHGARNGREHAMGKHLRQLAQMHDNVHVHVRYSQPDEADVLGRDHDSTGRIDITLLKRLLPFDDYEFYLCGPAPFMKTLYCGLLATGVAQARIHYEFFGPGSLLADEAKPVGPAASRSAEQELANEVQVTFARSGLTVPWDPELDTLLELAEHHGLNPDYSCRSGICQTCMSDLIEGEVEYAEEPLDPPGAKRVLICCARPRGNLVVDV